MSTPSTVMTLYRNELRMLLRDRRTVFMSIVLPILFMPIFLFGSSILGKKQEKKLDVRQFTYAVTGAKADVVRSLVAQTQARMGKDEKTKASFNFKEIRVEEWKKAIADKSVDMMIEGLSPDQGKAAWEEEQREKKAVVDPGGENEVEKEEVIPGAAGESVLRIYFRADYHDARTGVEKMRTALVETRKLLRDELVKERGLPVIAGDVAKVVENDIASEGQVAGLAIGRLLTLLLFGFMLSGGAIVATDALAGEKERGTLETLLTTAASRKDIVNAKFFSIFTVAIAATLIQVLNFLVYIGLKVIPVKASFAATVPPFTAVLLLLLYLPVAALASAVLLLVSGHAKSYKEAQLYFFPIFLLGMLPGVVTFLPGLTLRSIIVIVPVANIAMAVKEVLIGQFDWLMIALAWIVTAIAAALTTRLSVATLSNERLITATQFDVAEFRKGFSLFERQVLGWFAILWALMFIVGNQMGEKADIRLQLVVNIIGIFLLGSLVMLRRYQLPVREAWALRPVKPAVWLAVVLGAPAGIISGIGLARLANIFIPVPPKMIEEFGKVLVSDSMPVWQIILFLCILPGVCEEIAFRGMLLHGLHRRFHPAAVVAIVGIVFGIFHTALFRIVPTAFLGMLFATVTLLTGSIFPAMLWHALNNVIGTLGNRTDLNIAEMPVWFYGAGAAVLLCCFWIIWRNRTPYPGLRPWRKRVQPAVQQDPTANTELHQ